MKKKATTRQGARISMDRSGDTLTVEIARNNRKPFWRDHIIIVHLLKHQREALERDGVADAWFIKADGRRRMIE
jgi:hypothetical protein